MECQILFLGKRKIFQMLSAEFFPSMLNITHKKNHTGNSFVFVLFVAFLYPDTIVVRGRQHSFVEINHEIFSTVSLSLLLIQEGQLSVSGERMCTILVNRLED